MELLLGAGSSRVKKLHSGNAEWTELVTLDNNPDHKPDLVWDLEELPLPFSDSVFDELHAYEVLEHTGVQGDYKFFFAQFSEFHRLLVPNGLLFASVPKWDSIWAFGDPSHKRVISHASLVFLSQKEYEKQVGVTPMSDFRNIYKADFETIHAEYNGENFYFTLKAIK